MIDRRHLLKLGCAGVLGLSLPALAAKAKPRILVLLELNGGPDSLQLVTPFVDPAYAAARPKLKHGSDQVIRLNDSVGLHPKLAPLMDGWKAEDLAIIQGVGYARPNRSHFRSIEIWNQGGDRVHTNGWIGRLFAGQKQRPSDLIDGLILGGDPGPLGGPALRRVMLSKPERFFRQATDLAQDAPVTRSENPALAHILDVRDRLDQTAQTLKSKLQSTPAPTGFPRTKLGRQLATAAHVITAGVSVGVIKVRQTGYDTHSGQKGRLTRLVTQLGESLQSFRTALITSGDWSRVLLMTYSEFGRRVQQNGSGGTDHGTAASHFMLGGQVRGGLYGQMPSLTDLEGGDLRYGIDFRQLYRSAGERFLGLDGQGMFGVKALPRLIKG